MASAPAGADRMEWGWVLTTRDKYRAWRTTSGAVYRRMKNGKIVLAGNEVAASFRPQTNSNPNQGELDLEFPMKGYGK